MNLRRKIFASAFVNTSNLIFYYLIIYRLHKRHQPLSTRGANFSSFVSILAIFEEKNLEGSVEIKCTDQVGEMHGLNALQVGEGQHNLYHIHKVGKIC